MTKLSIIIPVYNVEMYLDQCIETIIAQTFKDYELIIVDDGSTDDSGRICDKWADKDNRIRVFHKENGGQLSARSYGVNRANGEYIAFIDSDDYVNKNLFYELFKIISVYYPDVLAYGYKRVREDGEYIDTILNNCDEGFYSDEKLNVLKKSLVSNVFVKEYNMGSIIYGVASKVFNRNFYLANVPDISTTIVNGEDMVVTMKCISCCNTLYVTNVTEYYYRQRNNSMLHTFRKKDIENYIKITEFLKKEVPCIPHENLEKFMCEVISHNIFMAAKEFDDFDVFKEYYAQNVTEYVLDMLKFASIGKIGIENWLRVCIIRYRIWGAFVLYRLVKKI